MEKPFLSFVIATYNRADAVVKSIESCLNQTDPDLEVIVIDDGSNDNTVYKLTEKYEGNPRIRIIESSRNQGAFVARNKGLKASAGEYCLIWDSDDILYPETVSEFKNFVRAHTNAALVYAPATFYRNGEALDIKPRETSDVSYDEVLRNILPHNDVVIAIRGDLARQTEFLGPNIDFTYYNIIAKKILDADAKIYHLNKILGEVYMESDTISESITRKVPNVNKSIARVPGTVYFLSFMGEDVKRNNRTRYFGIVYGLIIGLILKGEKSLARRYSKEYFTEFAKNIQGLSLYILSYLPFSLSIMKLLISFSKPKSSTVMIIA